MTKIDELKSEARRAEARGELDRATRLYLQAITAAETTDALPDPGLRVRVGDLEHRQGDPEAALVHYREAAELYADQGLLTNAVAVCNKILRLFPDRHECHARLAEFHLDMGLTADARRHALQFDDVVADGEPDAAPGAGDEPVAFLRSYLEREPDEEVAVRLAGRLEARGDEEAALDALGEVARRRHREGQEVAGLERRARALDPDVDTEAWAAARPEVRDGGAEGTPAGTEPVDEPPAGAGDLGEQGALDGLAGDEGGATDAGDPRAGDAEDAGHAGRDRAHLGVLQTLARLVEHRDFEAERHAERVGELSARLARRLGLPDDAVVMMGDAAPLHDIGMVVVPDRVLLKEGDLTPEEQSIMRGHAANGARILSGSELPVMRLAAEIARTHHERWDGGGYPRGLEGDAIPLSGRTVAVADAFEAMTHDRPYRAATSVEETLEEIRRHRGTHFDPRVVDALLEVQEDLAAEGEAADGLLRAL